MKDVIIKILTIILILIFIIYIAVISWEYIDDKNKTKEIKNNVVDIIEYQKQKDKMFEEFKEQEKNTFEYPKVIIDPYEVGFNSALLIFQTRYETPIKLSVNNVYIQEFESGTKHIIPITNLDYGKNEVTITTNENTSNSIEIFISTKDGYNMFTKLDNDNYIFYDENNIIYEMNLIGKIANVVYGVKEIYYNNDNIYINTYNNNQIVFEHNLNTPKQIAFENITNQPVEYLSSKIVEIENKPNIYNYKDVLNKDNKKYDLNTKNEYTNYKIKYNVVTINDKNVSVIIEDTTNKEIYKSKYEKYIIINKDYNYYIEKNNEIYVLNIK